MGSKQGGICALCGNSEHPLVKAHIIARGLFELNSTTGHSFAYIDEKGVFARRLDGLFLNRITCRNCEERIFTPLDNFAIRHFRDKTAGEFVDEKDGVRTHKVDGNCRHDFRAYFASLIYRFALGRDANLGRYINVGSWLNRLRNDLRCWRNAEFDYVDALCIEIRSVDADSFRVPRKMSIDNAILGFVVDIPHWRFFVSIGSKCHPYVRQLLDEGYLNAPLYSLSSDFNALPFCWLNVDHLPDRWNDLIDCILAYNRNAINGSRVAIE